MFAPSGILEQRLKRGTFHMPGIPPMRMLPRDAFLAKTEFVEFRRSQGRICAETLTPYPPGIPVIAPGEEITRRDRGLSCVWNLKPACASKGRSTTNCASSAS